MKAKDAIRGAAVGSTVLLAVSYSLTSTARANGNKCNTALYGCTNYNPGGGVGSCIINGDLGGPAIPGQPWTYDCACAGGGAIPWDTTYCIS